VAKSEENSITAGYCHKCGKLIPLLANPKTKKVTFMKCGFCGYQNEMENLKAFLRPSAKVKFSP
jgi:DNA-directed RNA polymerase subunit M/transcription elongation factor TFIIS